MPSKCGQALQQYTEPHAPSRQKSCDPQPAHPPTLVCGSSLLQEPPTRLPHRTAPPPPRRPTAPSTAHLHLLVLAAHALGPRHLGGIEIRGEVLVEHLRSGVVRIARHGARRKRQKECRRASKAQQRPLAQRGCTAGLLPCKCCTGTDRSQGTWQQLAELAHNPVHTAQPQQAAGTHLAFTHLVGLLRLGGGQVAESQAGPRIWKSSISADESAAGMGDADMVCSCSSCWSNCGYAMQCCYGGR